MYHRAAEINELFDRFEKGLADLEAWIGKESLGAARLNGHAVMRGWRNRPRAPHV